MAKHTTSFAVSFLANKTQEATLRTALDNALDACGTPEARRAFLVKDLNQGIALYCPGIKGYKVVPGDHRSPVAIEFDDRIEPNDHADIVTAYEELRRSLLRQAKSISEARGYKIAGQRGERSDKLSAAERLAKQYESLSATEKRAFLRAIKV